VIGVPEESSPASSEVGVACLPGLLDTNPYQRLLYRSLASEGVLLRSGLRLEVRSLLRRRGDVRVLHFHWPELHYRQFGGPRVARGPLSALRLAIFAARLATARLLGFRVVWTVHQLAPHEQVTPRVDRLAARLLARRAARLIVHDEATLTAIERELGPEARDKTRVIPHGSYAGVYPASRSRDDARAGIGINDNRFTVLSFGHIRAYKAIDLLLEAFARVERTEIALVIAGMTHDDAAEQALRRAAAADLRIRLILGFIPDEAVGDLFAAADAAVLARPDGGTSGSLVLALSQRLPVIASSSPAYRELVGENGWLFAPGDSRSLAAALETAAAQHPARPPVPSDGLVPSWPAVAAATADVFREALGSRERAGHRLAGEPT
jgi:beta-1,4-mannosyltransferase